MSASIDGREDEELNFLLRSLDDLDAEHAAGEIDDATYERVRADYVARAAAADRTRRGEPDSESESPPSLSRRRRVLVVGGVGVFALLMAAVLTAAIGDRRPGETLTGNAQIDASDASVTDEIDGYTERVVAARSLLASDPVRALEEFAAAAQLDPTAPEPLTYIAWLEALSAEQLIGAERDELLARSLDRLADARALDPEYSDAHAVTGFVLLNLVDDPDGAVPYLQRYLILDPAGPLGDTVRAALAQALAGSETPPASG